MIPWLENKLMKPPQTTGYLLVIQQFAFHSLPLSVINPQKCYKVIYDTGKKW